MVGYGIPHDEIASVVGITAKTLRKHYRAEIDTGGTKANAKVAESLFLQATGTPAVHDSHGNLVRAEQPRVPSAGIWWSKARMGWKETIANEHTGKGGGPVKSETTLRRRSYDSMTDEELLAELNARSAGA